MHKDETWQLYSPNGEPIEGVGWNAELDNPEATGSDAIVGVAVVFLYRRGKDGLEFLWQKRSEKIDRYPGDWDISAGGHINLGETKIDAAVREAREEIGAEIDVSELKLATMRPFNKDRFAWVYLVDYTDKVEDFHFDDEEVSEVKWVKYNEMKEFREKFAKVPLKKDDLTFGSIDVWLRAHGELAA